MRSCRLRKCNLFFIVFDYFKNENVFSSRIKSLLETGITQLYDRFSTGTMEGTDNKIKTKIKNRLRIQRSRLFILKIMAIHQANYVLFRRTKI